MFGRNRGIQAATRSITQSALDHGSLLKVATRYEDPITRLGGVVGIDPTCIHAAYLKHPEVVMTARIDQVVNFEQRSARILLTTRDEEYARGMNDPANPAGEVDFHISLPEESAGYTFAEELYWAVMMNSPAFAARRENLRRIAELMSRPESEWERCPICSSTFASRAGGAAACNECELVFCAAGLEPVLASRPDDYGAILDTRPFLPMTRAMVPLVEHHTTWIVRPRSVPDGPMALLDTENVQVAIRLGY
jgi:hypothetical protein